MSDLIGQTLQKRYHILRELGNGGQGQVFLAQDTQLSRQVAIKRLLYPQLAGVTQARFEREGPALARLKHPHIVEIYDLFKEEGVLYLVMEYTEAGSLADLLETPAGQRGLPVEDVVEIGKSLALALKVIHQQGFIHRDIKPGNVLISDSQDGWVVKLADFGVAHVPTEETQLTYTGDILGTLPYLAPEQLQLQAAVPKSDVYALAVLLYRLLTGQHYLKLDASPIENQRRIIDEVPPPLTEARPDVPGWLSDLIRQALSKEARQRPTAAQFYRQLVAAGEANSSRSNSPIQVISGIPPAQYGLYSLSTLLLAVILATAIASGLSIVGTLAYLDRLGNLAVALPGPVEQSPTPDLAGEEAELRAMVENTAPAEGLKLRAEPSLYGEVLDVLPEGTMLVVAAYDGPDKWALVQTEAGSGWVYGRYLRLVEEE